MATRPTKVIVRMYNVGFGDCFLVSFEYQPPLSNQHILIDFGTVAGAANMKAIANDIKKTCNGKLYAIVATHRHRDHISGFWDAGGKESTGAIIASCKPDLVLQPWTENPNADADATSAALLANKQNASQRKMFLASLNAMHSYAEAILQQAPRWRGLSGRTTRLEKLAGNNTKNADAVRNLRTMGKKPPRFLQYGSNSGLENPKLLPGVKVYVLGPPTLKQQNIKKYAKNSDQYWLGLRYWGLQDRSTAVTTRVGPFPPQARYGKTTKPFYTRWFVEHANTALKNNAFEMVSILDSFLNNTSVILLFEVNGKKLLFPGDAQLENWSWALQQKENAAMLNDVDFYKVGHHGSRNATPKDLWNKFKKRKNKKLRTMMSTRTGVYEKSEEGKVPAARLVDTLKRESVLKNTQSLKGFGPLTFEF